MKVVYVLVSEETDYYLEEFLISWYSLKLYNPNMEVWAVVDDRTMERLKALIDFLNEVHFVTKKFEDSVSMHLRSRYLKTSLREIINGDFLYLDCDTLIAGSLEELFELDTPINMVLDGHNILQEKIVRRNLNQIIRIFEPEFQSQYEKYFNSGVIFCKDCKEAHEFFNEWGKEYRRSNKYGNFQDQPPLHYTNIQNGAIIAEIDGKFNCQMDRGVKYLHDARVIHYLGINYEQSNFLNNMSYVMHEIADESLFQEFRKNHYEMTERLLNILNNPRGSVKDLITVPVDSLTYQMIKSKSFLMLCIKYNKMKTWFKIEEKIIGKIIAGYRLFKNRKHDV